jgi:hypothetical protein
MVHSQVKTAHPGCGCAVRICCKKISFKIIYPRPGERELLPEEELLLEDELSLLCGGGDELLLAPELLFLGAGV